MIENDPNIAIFCLSYNNTSRKARIQRVFAEQGLSVHFYGGVDPSDARIRNRSLDKNNERCWSIMYGHLDMLKLFAESGKEFGIFCEDDILVRKDFGEHLPKIVNHFCEMQLDVLLLGNLCSNPDFRFASNFPERVISDYSTHPFRYYAYNSDPASAVWGTQMYMLHKTQAKYLLQKYTSEYADKTIYDKTLVPFSADWTITKEGEKAIIYPLVAIEMRSEYDDEGQDMCRKKCYNLFYSPDLFT